MPPKSSCLCSEHLLLKAICPEDADQVMDILFHPDVGQTYMLPDFSEREKTRTLFERIMHLSLQNDRFVITSSEGEEPYRHVVVSPKRSGRKENRVGAQNDAFAGTADAAEFSETEEQ